MNKSNKIFCTIAVISPILLCSVLFFPKLDFRIIEARENQNDYSLILSKENNKFFYDPMSNPSVKKTGVAIAKTEIGNNITFGYENICQDNAAWQRIPAGGFFYNIDPLGSMSEIALNFGAGGTRYKVYWSEFFECVNENFKEYQAYKTSTGRCDFNGDKPNFFKIECIGNEGSVIQPTNIEITYSCQHNPGYRNLSVVSTDVSCGTVETTASGKVMVGEEVTIKATPNPIYGFAGWYKDSELVTNENIYTFNKGTHDEEYVAHFLPLNNYLDVTSNDANGGTVSGAGRYNYGTVVNLTATPKQGYIFDGWYINDILLSMDENYAYTMPLGKTSIVGKFYKNLHVTVKSEDTNKGVIVGESSFYCPAGHEATVRARPNKDYAFLAWNDYSGSIYFDSEYTFVMGEYDVELTAIFKEKSDYKVHKVDVSYDDTKGSVDGDFYYYQDYTVRLSATAKKDCVFVGWFSDPYYKQLLTTDENYSFKMSYLDVQLYAKFLNISDLETDKLYFNGVLPKIYEEQQRITYGLYPQTHVNDSELISNLNQITNPESNGWYLYNGYYYAKTVANYIYTEDYTVKFDDGTEVINGETYWFRCESILWDILKNDTGTYYLLSSKLLDAHRFNVDYSGEKQGYYANSYENSELRSWLNNEFYNSAFNLDGSCVLTTEVDNSASTTSANPNKYACNNTLDKIFLPCYQDFVNSPQYLDNNIIKRCYTTDWARANGAFLYGYTSATYWMRSPRSNDHIQIEYVSETGNINTVGGDPDETYRCVRPAMSFKVA